MNIIFWVILLFGSVNALSVAKPTYRRITPEMVARRIRNINQRSKIMLKIKLILSRKNLI